MEAVVIRSLFTAYDIPVLISSENHARIAVNFFFGSPVGPFCMYIFVNRAHAEDAGALLAGMRGSDHVLAGDDNLDGASVEDPCHVGARPISAPLCARAHRWGNTALALLFATVLGFGAAHLYYLRPWGRGAALAIAQLAVLVSFAGSLYRFAVVLGIARLADILGILREIWSDTAGEEANTGSSAPA